MQAMSERGKYTDPAGLLLGGMSALTAYGLRSGRAPSEWAEAMDRANLVNQNWHSDMSSGQLGFKNADNQLHQSYIKSGLQGLQWDAPKVWQRQIGEVGIPWTPADISKAGEFLRQRKEHLPSILTVTPDANSARFGDPATISTDVVGGGASNTLWGNGGQPMYSYAEGNFAVGRRDFANPSAHFSEVELPEAERGRYLTTSEANSVGDGRGWGVSGSETAPVTSGRDVHFGKEYRKSGGLTTANDLYTWIKEQGFEPPSPTGKNSGTYLKELTELVSDLQDKGRTPYQVLESMASPTPLWGDQVRETGNLPVTDSLQWRSGGGGLSKGSFEAGANTYFDVKQISDDAPLNRSWVEPDGMHTDADAFIRDNVPDAPTSGPGRSLIRRHLPGAVGVLATSPEAAAQLRQGNVGNAAAITGTSYAAGELIGAGTNALVDQAVKKGAYWAPKAARALGQAATPLVGLDVIDTATTLATGKNSREVLVESGNTGPAVAASMAPASIAPLGMAGGPVQATVPINKKRYAEAKKLEAKAEAAKKRGGRWRFAGFNVPEFGLSEMFGLN